MKKFLGLPVINYHNHLDLALRLYIQPKGLFKRLIDRSPEGSV